MDSAYKYYKENGKLMRLHIERDDDPLNPRIDCDNIGKIVCWGRTWGNLGDDENNWNDEEDFFKELCMKYLTKEQIELLVNKRMAIVSIEPPTVEKPNKAEYERDIKDMVSKYDAMFKKAEELGLPYEATRYVNMAQNYKKNRESEFEKNLELSREYTVKNDIGNFPYKGSKKECEDYINGELRESLFDGDVFYLSAGMYKEAMEMLEESDVVILPVYVFEHSGISISISDFGDRWDSGQAGWIYTTKEKIENSFGVTGENWRERAIEILKEEIKVYDMYLEDEVYGIITEEYDADNDNWIEKDSCWGYFNDKWGNELIREIALDYGINETLYDSVLEVK